MPNATNSMTNTLQLVQTRPISAFFSQTINPENGFSLELFRGGNHVGSIQSSQAQPLVAKKGDMLYRINLGPHLQQVTGYLRVEGKYTREYGVQVTLQVVEPSHFLELYRQGRDPVHLAVLDIQAAIQEYADRTAYENIHPTNIQAKATYAFSKEPSSCKAGLRIVSVHNPSLGNDKAFQPIDIHPILTMNGKLPTKEGYVRNYLLTIGLSVTDSRLYRYMEHTGTFPLDRAKDTIHNELQSYTSQNFYEDISDVQMRSTITHAFDGVSDRFIGGMEIVHIQHFSLEADKTYQPINVSPIVHMDGQLTTREDYVRSYELTVELSVTNYKLYRYLKYSSTENTPIDLAKIAIDGELQKYARQQFYEDLTDLQLRSVVEHTFDSFSNPIKECLAIGRVHHLSIGDDKTYKPINLSPLLEVNGKLTTREDYVRGYTLVVELLINDRQPYQRLMYEGANPLDHAKVAINGELQKYARQQFYEDLSEIQMFAVVKHAFDTLSSRVTDCITIIRPHRLSLEEDKTYQSINLSPLLTMSGQLSTREGYVRNYELLVELSVTDRWVYLQLTREGTEPLSLAKVAIDGELQKYAYQQFYEDLSETQLLTIVEHAFDGLSSRVTGGLGIVRSHRLTLEEDLNYHPINLSPLLTVNGQLTTEENYVCDYKFTVEILIKNRRRYQELIQEGVTPLDHATLAIDGELQKYARQKSYEDLATIELDRIVEQAFNDLSSRVTYDMEIVRAHRFSLKEPAEYIHLGPRTLTITGKLETADLRERAYEITVMLEIVNSSEFIQLTRRGGDSNPLHLVRMAIEGAIQRRAVGKTHDELSEQDLPPASYEAFTNFADSTIGGLKLAEAHKVILHVDPRIREKKDIGYQTDVEKTRLEHQADLEKTENYFKFELAKQTEMQELALAEPRQAREKAQYIFDLEKKATIEAQQFRGDLAQKLLAQLTERISEDLEANVPLFEIVEEMKALNSVLQPGIPQNTGGTGANGYTQLQNSQQPQSPALEAGQASRHIPQTSSASSMPKPSKKDIPEWGILLTEIPTPAALHEAINDGARVFQVWEISEEAFIQESPFQETDILMKINGRPVYTLKALEAALHSIHPGTKVNVMVLREQALKRLILDWPSTRGMPEHDIDDRSHE